jgi:hypothetical protein
MESPVTLEQAQYLLEQSEDKVENAEMEVRELRIVLAEERENSRRPQKKLDAQMRNCDDLMHRLSVKKKHSAQQY